MAQSPKPIYLFCNVPYITNVHTYQARDWLPSSVGVFKQHVDAEGVTRTSGDSQLKATQTYPD
eukprot:7160349-Alexandrium_andersonii.AAC.1